MGGLRLAAALLGLLLAGAASAQNLEVSEGLEQVLEEGSIEINADFLEYERGRGLYTARGNVVVRQTDRTIRADWVSFNQLTGVGVASGNVTVSVASPSPVRKAVSRRSSARSGSAAARACRFHGCRIKKI